MKYLAKYTSIVLERGLADSQEYAELLVDTLYQLAFTGSTRLFVKKEVKCPN